MSLKIILGCIYFVILLFVPDHLVGRQWVLILLMLGFMNWVQDLSGACISWFMAEERMEKVLYVQLIHYGGMMLAAAATIYFDLGLTTLISGYIIAALLGFYSAIVMIFREGIPIRLIFVPRMIKYLFEQSLPLFGVVLINAIYINADTIMIREYQNINNVAYYQAAYKLLFVLQGLTLLHTALFPKLSILVKNSQKLQTNQLNWIVALFTMIVLVPIAVLANVYAPEILLLLYGDKMLPAVGALQFLIWVGVIYFIKIYVMNLFIANGQQKPLFYIALAALVLNLILDAYFLNHYSFAVAAAVLLFTETFMLVTLVVLRYMQTRKFVDIRSNRLPYMY
jgi:O-antigen/teichoic acid export membrane protein